MNKLNDIFFTASTTEGLTYEQVLEDVQHYFSENHASTIAGDSDKAGDLLWELMTQYIVKRKYALDGMTTEELCARLYEDMAGYSFLKKWIYRDGVEEVNINAYNDIEVIMNSGRSIKIPDKFSSPQHAIDVVRRMLNACGMVIDDTMPSAKEALAAAESSRTGHTVCVTLHSNAGPASYRRMMTLAKMRTPLRMRF